MKLLSDQEALFLKDSNKYSKIVEKMAEEVDAFMPDWVDSKEDISRWGHSYFCNEDGGRLIFDPKKRHEHECSICHKIYTGFPYDGVWTYFLRNTAIVAALKSSVVYRVTGKKEYLDIAKRIIGFYAENYTSFILHNKENFEARTISEMKWGSGRMMPQSLNESIVIIRVIQALLILDDDLDDDFKNLVKTRFMRPMIEVMTPQVDEIHNIRVWLMAAIGSMSLYLEDKELYDWVMHSEFGIDNQLKKGVTADGFWYEGSIHYNFFLLEGVTSFMMLAKIYGADIGKENLDIVEKMLVNAYHYAFSTNNFPNPNDGWPNLNMKTFGYVYQMASSVYGEDSPVGNILKIFMAKNDERTTLPLSESYYCMNEVCLEELTLNSTFDWTRFVEVPRKSYNYSLSNFAMLRKSGLEVFLKYGLNGPSHAHPDCLGLEVEYKGRRVSRDISNAGYNSTLCKKWHRKSLAHNTIIVDGQDQKGTEPGTMLSFSDDRMVAENVHAVENVRLTREIVALENGFKDIVRCESQEAHTYDVAFHLEKEYEIAELKGEPAELGYSDCGYEYSKDVVELKPAYGKVHLKAEGNGLEISIDVAAENAKVFVFKSMDNPVSSLRTTILVRRTCGKAEFETKVEFKEN